LKRMMVLATLTLMWAVVSVSAQETSKISGFLESQTNFENGRGETSTGVNALVNVALTKKTGLYVFAQTSKGYSQVYAGPTYSPKPWIQFGTGVGVEQAKHPFRAGGFVWVGKGKVSNLLIVEKGATKGSGWYKDILNVQVADRVGVGVISQRFLGTGLYGQVKLSKHFLLWGAPTYDFASHKMKGTIGLRYNF